MKRAKFETLNKQKEFFVEVKNKLGVGAKNLSKMIGLKSRGRIESYTFMRTAPPIEIVKKLENISGIKANYEIIDGKVHRKKRGFVPLDPKDAKDILKRKFKKDFIYLKNIIKTNLTIEEIIKKIREKGYSFNNSIINRCIGAYRTNILLEVIKDIIPAKGEIIVKGHVTKGKNTLDIRFYLKPLLNIIKRDKLKVKLQISEDRKKIRLIPLDYGRNLIKSGGSIIVLVTEKSDLKRGSDLEIFINPEKFGFKWEDSLYDKDSKDIIKYAIKKGFKLDIHRNTPINHKGDISLYKESKNIIIEITKAISSGKCYFKIGQLFVQKASWPNAIHFLICKKELLSKNIENSLIKGGIKIIYSEFEKNWGEDAIKKMLNKIEYEDK